MRILRSLPLFLVVACLAGGGARAQVSITRIGFLPFVPESDEAAWLGHLLAEGATRALDTNAYADVPDTREVRSLYLDLTGTLVESADEDPIAVAQALDLDYVVHGWVRLDGAMIVLDAELADAANGERLVAQTYRAEASRPLDAALALASRVSDELLGGPLYTYALSVVEPVPLDPEVLERFGRGLASLDKALAAEARADAMARAQHLRDASNLLAQAVNRQPAFLWPYDSLLDASERILEREPQVGSAYVNIAVAYQALGDTAEAAAILRQGATNAPHSALVRVALVDRLLDLAARDAGRRTTLLTEALEHAEAATLIDATLPAAWESLGAAAFDSGSYPRAEQAYARAVGLAPTDPVAALGLGLSLLRQGKWEDARPHLERVATLDRGGYAARARAELDRIAGF